MATQSDFDLDLDLRSEDDDDAMIDDELDEEEVDLGLVEEDEWGN